MSQKHCWNRRKWWFQAFFPTMFSAYSSTTFTICAIFDSFNLDKAKILSFGKESTLPHNLDFKQPKKALGNIVGKGVNAGYQHFFLLPLCSLLYQREKSSF